MTINKSQREQAKREGKFLYQISLDARFVPSEIKKKFRGKVFLGRWEMCGPMKPEDAVKVWRLFCKLTQANQI